MRAIKWIYNEENVHYSASDIYLRKCKELNLLPMYLRFQFVDLVMLYKILHSLVTINLPNYLHFFSGKSRLRFCHLDNLSLVSDIVPRTTANQNNTTNAFANSFFYRTHLLWNRLPYELREIDSLVSFKKRLKLYFLQNLLSNPDLDESLGNSQNSNSQ